ncbi:MAG: leucine-rich repeat domain-containing protein [Oscillospiraceae bacterium]|nr:leucine-rich repeat domain-containing protein [Oscillospiraceae bacterium]
MKRKVTLLLALVMLTTMFAFAGCSSNPSGGNQDKHIEGSAGLEYTLSEDGTYYIWSSIGTCTDKDVVVGNWHEGLPVKEIVASLDRPEGPAGYKDWDIETLTISDGITTLNFGACSIESVKRVVFPDGIEEIAQCSLSFCINIEEVVFGKGLKTIAVDVFRKNEGSLKTIYFRGTEEEWNQIEIDQTGNDCIQGATIVFNYTGD